jgi:hypothetical protein
VRRTANRKPAQHASIDLASNDVSSAIHGARGLGALQGQDQHWSTAAWRAAATCSRRWNRQRLQPANREGRTGQRVSIDPAPNNISSHGPGLLCRIPLLYQRDPGANFACFLHSGGSFQLLKPCLWTPLSRSCTSIGGYSRNRVPPRPLRDALFVARTRRVGQRFSGPSLCATEKANYNV